MVIYDPSHSLFQRCATEVDQQPYGLPGKAEICQQLFAVDCVQLLYRFDFNEKAFVDQQIDPEGRFEAHPFKLDIYRSLPCHMVTQTG